MEVTILGFSGGVQAVDSGNTSLLVQGGGASVLVDVSASPLRSLLEAGCDPLSLDALFLTHAHVDHLYALPSLIHNLWLLKRTKPLVVCGNAQVLAKAIDLFCFFGLEKKKGMMPIAWKDKLDTIGGLKVCSFPLLHSPGIETNGYTFTDDQGAKFAYFPDSVAKEPYPECAYGASLVVHEAGGTKETEKELVRRGHSSARMAATLARSLGAKRLVLVHLPCEPERRAAILHEAKSVFPSTELPVENRTYHV